MVRRRIRTIKVSTIEIAKKDDYVAPKKESSRKVNGRTVDDNQYFASPKRKECKIESNTSSGVIIENNSNNNQKSETTATSKQKVNYNTLSKTKSVHVPLVARSQKTKTIDKFFKINVSDESKNEPILRSISPASIVPPHAFTNDNQSPNNIDDLYDDTEEDTCTELSDEYQTHRQLELAHIDDSDSGVPSYCCTSRSSTENIFLQEPVLSLNVDKTINQLTSFKINKTLQKESIFSSSTSTTASSSLLSGKFNSIVNPISSSSSSNYYLLSLENDNSSCDSGIDNNCNSVQNNNGQRKPATPHRIVCPSPIKASNNQNEHLKSSSSSDDTVNDVNSICKSSSNINQDLLLLQTSNKNQLKKCRKKLDRSPIKRSHKTTKNYQQQQQNRDEISYVTSTAINHKSIAKINRIYNNNNNLTKIKNKNHELNEYFEVRKSHRKTKTALEEELNRKLEKAIIEEQCDGLKIAYFDKKGRGIIADKKFQRGDFVVEYIGDLINMTEAGKREKMYALDENAGCYMYYFKHQNQQYCIDATIDTGKFGRLINHSRNGNLLTKIVVVKSRPHLVLIAKDDIEIGEELTYDYGDRSKEALLHHPWLAF